MRWRSQFAGALAPALAVANLTGCVTLHGTYLSEVKAELAQPIAFAPGPMDERALQGLPAPVRAYYFRCRFAGRPAMKNARIGWGEFRMRQGRDKGWMSVQVRQFNSAARPARFVYLHALLGGILPFNGRDKYQDGKGNMLIRAAGLFTIADAKSKHMDRSGLVTYLAEALMVPSAALQSGMRWEPIDAVSARATLSYSGDTVSGIFRFNGDGEFISFETRDRWQDGHDDAPIAWSITAAEYQDLGGFRLPTLYTATWHEPAGDFEYFRGRLAAVEFNVEEP